MSQQSSIKFHDPKFEMIYQQEIVDAVAQSTAAQASDLPLTSIVRAATLPIDIGYDATNASIASLAGSNVLPAGAGLGSTGREHITAHPFRPLAARHTFSATGLDNSQDDQPLVQGPQRVMGSWTPTFTTTTLWSDLHCATADGSMRLDPSTGFASLPFDVDTNSFFASQISGYKADGPQHPWQQVAAEPQANFMPSDADMKALFNSWQSKQPLPYGGPSIPRDHGPDHALVRIPSDVSDGNKPDGEKTTLPSTAQMLFDCYEQSRQSGKTPLALEPFNPWLIGVHNTGTQGQSSGAGGVRPIHEMWAVKGDKVHSLCTKWAQVTKASVSSESDKINSNERSSQLTFSIKCRATGKQSAAKLTFNSDAELHEFVQSCRQAAKVDENDLGYAAAVDLGHQRRLQADANRTSAVPGQASDPTPGTRGPSAT